jgi:hypothetical protein
MDAAMGWVPAMAAVWAEGRANARVTATALATTPVAMVAARVSVWVQAWVTAAATASARGWVIATAVAWVETRAKVHLTATALGMAEVKAGSGAMGRGMGDSGSDLGCLFLFDRNLFLGLKNRKKQDSWGFLFFPVFSGEIFHRSMVLEGVLKRCQAKIVCLVLGSSDLDYRTKQMEVGDARSFGHESANRVSVP